MTIEEFEKVVEKVQKQKKCHGRTSRLPVLEDKILCSYLSEEGCPSSLDFKTVRETFASYGFSLGSVDKKQGREEKSGSLTKWI